MRSKSAIKLFFLAFGERFLSTHISIRWSPSAISLLASRAIPDGAHNSARQAQRMRRLPIKRNQEKANLPTSNNLQLTKLSFANSVNRTITSRLEDDDHGIRRFSYQSICDFGVEISRIKCSDLCVNFTP